jgi:hypothetical protein
MNTCSALLTAFVLLALSGCRSTGRDSAETPASSTQPVTAILSWREYEGDFEKRNDALYTINAEVVGRGRKGFRRVLEFMASMPKGSTLRIEFIDKTNSATTSGPGYWMPFQDDKMEFMEVAEKHGIKLVFPPGPFG